MSTNPIDLSAMRLAWVDMEMTGLDPDMDHVMEIAGVVTDGELNVLAESGSIVIHQDAEILGAMHPWCVKAHADSGLTARSLDSRVTVGQAEAQMLAFFAAWMPRGSSPLCGNSVWQDRRFMARHMPQLEDFFHYRVLDVSSLAIAAACWGPPAAAEFKKARRHTAVSDIHESIAQLRHYRAHLLAQGVQA